MMGQGISTLYVASPKMTEYVYVSFAVTGRICPTTPGYALIQK